MDPDFGITTWYLKPTFYAKILWLIMSVSALIYEIVLISMVLDGYYQVAIGSGTGALAVFIFIFTVISCAGNLLYYFKVLPKFGKYMLFGACGATGLTLILGIIYAAVFGSNANRQKVANKITTFNFVVEDIELVKWFILKYGDDVTVYVNNRTTNAGEAIIGLLVTWFILQGALLFIFLQENDYEGLGNTDPVMKNTE